MSSLLWIILAAVAIIIFWLVGTYNRLVTLKNRSEEGWSDIDVQLKRRHDLIPNLVNTVKGYASHEASVFTEVTKARTAALSAGTIGEVQAAENQLSQALKSLFAVAESYPELKASVNFLQLQDELSDTENKIQAARRFYNGLVRDLNTALETFPSNLVGNVFKFNKREFFAADEVEKENVEVKF
ncbi:LemA family protein [Patescibacteria group bacterium]|nr:LemA family protein [Patescibacteria group bacterium]